MRRGWSAVCAKARVFRYRLQSVAMSTDHGLRLCEHQVGGHMTKESKPDTLVDDAGRFYKPYQGDARSAREVAFYQLVWNPPAQLPSTSPLQRSYSRPRTTRDPLPPNAPAATPEPLQPVVGEGGSDGIACRASPAQGSASGVRAAEGVDAGVWGVGALYGPAAGTPPLEQDLMGLRAFVPRMFGTAEVAGRQYCVMEDVCHAYLQPCVLDVKWLWLTAFTNVAAPGSCLVYNGSGHLALQPHGSGSMAVQSDEADSDSEDEEEGSRQAAADMETTLVEPEEEEEEEEGSKLGSELLRVELSSEAADPAKETTKLWRYLAGQPITKADISEYIKLAELALVMTTGSVEEERMFSAMAYLKDDTRNRLQECHLNVCARVFSSNQFDLDMFPVERAINKCLLMTLLCMGYVTQYAWATEAYREKCRVKDQATTQSSMGFRISGLQVYRQQEGEMKKMGRSWGKTLTQDTLHQAFTLFADNGALTPGQVWAPASPAIVRLQQLLAWLEQQTSFCFFQASLLFTYEGTATSLDTANLQVHFIDFAHTFPTPRTPDLNVLTALQSLLALLAKVSDQR
ncbi:hypothetical protein QJQ45_020081 [Haematococcus lacustris]|nr:hypothetical protein QJQ45_020081 [Haematococcus lacustris]